MDYHTLPSRRIDPEIRNSDFEARQTHVEKIIALLVIYGLLALLSYMFATIDRQAGTNMTNYAFWCRVILYPIPLMLTSKIIKKLSQI